MRNFCVVCFLACALSFVFCFSANANVSNDDAKKAVEDAQKKVKTVSKKVKEQLKDAKSVLGRVEFFKKKTEDAESQSKEAAKGNTEAKKTVEKIKDLSKAVVALYPDTKERLGNAVSRLEKLFSEAESLEAESNINITPNQGKLDDFTDTNSKASSLTTKAEELDNNVTDVTNSLKDVYSTANNMVESAGKAQLANIEVSAIIAVAQIQSMLESADNIINQIEKNKDKANVSVKQMKEILKTAPNKLFTYINGLCMKAEYELSDFSYTINKAKKAKADMLEEKEAADEALTKVKEATSYRDAMGELNNVKFFVKEAKKIDQELESALRNAKTAVTVANNWKQQALEEIAKNNKTSPTVQSKSTGNVDFPKAEGTESSPKDAKIQPTIIKTEQTVRKELLHQSKSNSEYPVQDTTTIPKRGSTITTTAIKIEKTGIETSENSMSQASEQLGIVQSEQLKDKHSEILKEKLRQGAQSETEIALIGKNIPALSNENDSSATVSVPLLVALIASAVFQ